MAQTRRRTYPRRRVRSGTSVGRQQVVDASIAARRRHITRAGTTGHKARFRFRFELLFFYPTNEERHYRDDECPPADVGPPKLIPRHTDHRRRVVVIPVRFERAPSSHPALAQQPPTARATFHRPAAARSPAGHVPGSTTRPRTARAETTPRTCALTPLPPHRQRTAQQSVKIRELLGRHGGGFSAVVVASYAVKNTRSSTTALGTGVCRGSPKAVVV